MANPFVHKCPYRKAVAIHFGNQLRAVVAVVELPGGKCDTHGAAMMPSRDKYRRHEQNRAKRERQPPDQNEPCPAREP